MFNNLAVPPTGPSPLQGPERRQHVRYPANPATSIYLVTSGQGVLFPDQFHDISAGGLRLVLRQELAPGTVATVDLYNIVRAFSFQIQLAVAYTIDQPDGSVVHGCTFSRTLHNVELWGLL
jgi:hypothetical protein